MVYVLDPARKAELLPKLRDRFQKLEGVATVVGEADFSKYGVAAPESDDRFPDLWLSAKSGYSFTDSAEGEDPVVPRATKGGTHGYLPDHPDLYATLVLSGRGIRPGTDLGLVRNIDVAPTIARLLDVAMPTAEGSPLAKALEE